MEILEYTYTKNAWDFVREKFQFDIVSKKVFYGKTHNCNEAERLDLIGYIEPNEIVEMVSYVNNVNFSIIKLNSKLRSFDAGTKTYNIILN